MGALLWSRCNNPSKIITPEVGPEGVVNGSETFGNVKPGFDDGVLTGGYFGWTLTLPPVFSFECWIVTKSDSNGDRYLMVYPLHPSMITFEMYYGVFYVALYIDEAWVLGPMIPWTYGFGELHHVGVAVNGTNATIRVFVDGIEKANSGYWIQNPITAPFVVENLYNADNSGYYRFAVDNIKFWDYEKLDYSDRFNEGIDTLPIPTNVQATQNRPEFITTSWNAVPGVGIEYKVQRADTEFGSYADVSGWISGLSYDDATALVETYYWYRVKAKQGATESEFSLGVEGFRPIAIPDVPSNVTATTNLSAKVRVAWDASARASSYQVQRSLFSVGPYSDISGWNAPLLFDDTTAVPGTHYWYKVKSKNNSGESNLSSEAEGFRPVPSKFVLINCFNRIRGLINDN